MGILKAFILPERIINKIFYTLLIVEKNFKNKI